jgi:hypothetical protein
MPLYEDRCNAVNRIPVDSATALAIGPQAAANAIVAALRQRAGTAGRRIAASLDGWYGVVWAALAGMRSDNDTDGRFLHALTLTVGQRVIVRSKQDPRRRTDIELFQSAVIPAGLGPYEIVNCFNGGGQNTVVQLRWKKG